MDLLLIFGVVLLIAVMFFPLRADANASLNFLKFDADLEINMFGLNVDRFNITLKGLKNKRGKDIKFVRIPKYILRIAANIFKTCKLELTEKFFVSAENDAFTSCMVGGSEVVLMSIINAQIVRIKKVVIVKNYVKCDTKNDRINLLVDGKIETNLFMVLLSVVCGLVRIKL